MGKQGQGRGGRRKDPTFARIAALYRMHWDSAKDFAEVLAPIGRELYPNGPPHLHRARYWEGRLSTWNQGTGTPEAYHLRVMAAALGTTVDALVSGMSVEELARHVPPSVAGRSPVAVAPPAGHSPAPYGGDWRADLLEAVAAFTRAANQVRNAADRLADLEAQARERAQAVQPGRAPEWDETTPDGRVGVERPKKPEGESKGKGPKRGAG